MRSDNVTKGVQQAPHRSLMNALGMTEEEKNRPLIEPQSAMVSRWDMSA